MEIPIFSAENLKPRPIMEILKISAEKPKQDRNMENSNFSAEIPRPTRNMENLETSAEKLTAGPNVEISRTSAEISENRPKMEISSFSAENVSDKFAEIHAKLLPMQKILASGGHVRSYWKNHRGTRFGPYYRVVYQHDGHRRSLYLGSDPRLADQVIRLLENWQRGRRDNLYLRSLRKKIRAALRHEMANLEELLTPLGFRRKGYAFHHVRSQEPTES